MTAKLENDKPCFTSGDRVEVLLPRPFAHGFDYVVPDDMRLQLGDYVSVPFGPREMVGVVWGEGRQEVAANKCKAVLQHHAFWPPLNDSLRTLIHWVADYTLAPIGMVLKMVLPVPDAIIKPPQEVMYALQHVEAGKLTPARKSVIESLQQTPQLPANALGASSAILAEMLKAGMLKKTQTMALPARPEGVRHAAPELRSEQRAAAEVIKAADGFEVFALEGITGSGKTEVYFDAIEALLEQDEGQTLVLLPEIALTTQWMQRFEARFGKQAALWHSNVSPAKRRSIWQAVAAGTAPLVVGARSALFLPYRDLRLIIVDEEHEPSYKQEEGVLYQARDMAVARAKHEDIPVVLCSATLSLETQANAQAGKYTLLELRERHGDYHEPTPQLIDLRADKPESGRFIAPPLQHAVAEAIGQGHQAMLFLNRRGYAPLLLCRGCGHRFACPNCSAWMVQHVRPARLQCHHCDWRQSTPKACPECASDDLVPCGPGVERIEEEARALFPEARIVTFSSDAAAMAEQMAAVIAGDIDLIIGTQMIAKGHHFPKLALVGVIDGDLGLEGGDLRAGERCYQLLHQIAGRAGRAEIEGRVLIQTTQPEHPLMQAIAAADREGFMREEMRLREAGGWPPHGRLAGLLLEGFDEAKVRQAALMLIQTAPRYEGITYLGPAPAPIARARNKYRYRILVKAAKNIALQKVIKPWVSGVDLPSGVKLKMDIDPYQFL
jgi:primosomal protein N' (replication factor Y)